MRIYVIEDSSYVVVSKLDQFDRGHTIMPVNVEEIHKNFGKYLYTMKKEDVKKHFKKEDFCDVVNVGKKVKRFHITKPLWRASEEYFGVEIDRDKDEVKISYQGAAPVDAKGLIFFEIKDDMEHDCKR